MSVLKTLQGILALVDIVNFSTQANKLGETFTAQYTDYFQEKIKSIGEKYRFQVVRSLGDAVVLFGTEPGGILDIMLDLFHRDKPEDKFGFVSKFRMVAHSGFFQFKMENNKPIDLVSPEGIKIFRMEKHARSWELVVTHALFQGIRPLVTQKHMEINRMVLKESLKGFDNEEWFPPFYRLRIVPQLSGVSNLLEHRMKELEQNVQSIPVFGNIYPPVPMDKNFINLSMKWDPGRDRKDAAYLPVSEGEAEEKTREPIKRIALGTWGERDEWLYHEFERKSLSYVREIDVPTLYEKHGKGIIFGLPGAGKTTILRHLVFQEFKSSETAKENQKRIVLFVPCRGIPFFDQWYARRYGEDWSGEPVQESVLEYMTWVFLFGIRNNYDLTPEEWVQFQDAGKVVKQAFRENRLTLLVDALDEAPDSDSKDRIRTLFMKLAVESEKGNRLFLTSRPSERIRLKQKEIPVFYVLSLTMDQVRAVARQLMVEDSDIYKKFDQAIWQEEVVTKMAATPITALLVTAYFQAYEKFHHRFPMYDLLVKFILLKVWESIKIGGFSFKNLDLFFKEVKKPDFLEKHRETRIFYDALASLCFHLFYDTPDGKIQRSVNEETLMMYFTQFIDEYLHYDEEGESAVEADQWIERFHADHLLLQAGKSEYVFVHSTVMEYLAAFHLVQQIKKDKDKERLYSLLRKCLGKEDYLVLETLPIAAGSDILRGFAILFALRDINVEYRRELLYEMGIKCLAELEWQITKTFHAIRIESLKKPVLDIVRQNREAVQWVYSYLKESVFTDDKDRIKDYIERFDAFIKLSHDTLLKEYLDYKTFDTGDSELVELRKRLLLQLVQTEVMEKWIDAHQQREKKAAAIEWEIEFPMDRLLQLDTHRYHPEDKNFNYYQNIVGKELVGFFGSPNLKHSAGINSCVFSSDGKIFVSASDDNTLKLWDVSSGKEIRTYFGHEGQVLGCAISSDGKTLVSASSDKTLKLWNVESGKEVRAFTDHQSPVWGCAISPDGKTLVSASSDNTLKLWDIESGKEVRAFIGHQSPVLACAITSDGKSIVSASWDRTLKQWDVSSGKETRSFNGHQGPVNSFDISLDGKTLVSASDDHTLKLWDVSSGKVIRAFFGHRDPVNSCAFSSNGKTFVSASYDNTLKMWDVESGKEICTFTGHKGPVNSCAFSSNDKTIVSASIDNTLKMWDVESGKEVRAFTGHQSPVLACAITSDGKSIVSASWDRTLKQWDVSSGKEIRSFNGHQGPVNSFAISPDGKTLVSASDDHTLKQSDVSSGKVIRAFTGHWGPVNSCAFSSNGKTLVSASYDNTLKLWDVESGKEICTFTGHRGSVNSCAFSSNDKIIVSASIDNTLKLWDVESGKEIRTFTGHKGPVWGCAFSSDGKTFVSASEDKTLKLWDAVSCKEILAFTGHQSYVCGCVFSSDGKKIVSVSYDETLKLWDARTGKLLKSLEMPWIPSHVSISPANPAVVITANLNGTVTMFEFEELKD